jgi:PAS domain S-box-containing protein
MGDDFNEAAFRFLRQVVDLDPNLIFAKDRKGRFVFANQAVADAYGTTIGELIGRTDADFNPNAAEVDHYLHDDNEVMDLGVDKFIPEEQVTDRSRRTRWFQTAKRAIRSANGSIEHVLGVSVDITVRKRIEDDLRRRSQRLFEEQTALLDLARLESSSLPEALAQIANVSARILDVARVSIWQFDDHQATRVHVHCAEAPGEVAPPVSIAFADHPELFTVLEQHRTITIEDAHNDPRTKAMMLGPASGLGIASFLTVPLRLDGKLFGVVVNAHVGAPRRWTLEEESFAAAVADFVPLAFEADRRRSMEGQLVQAQKMEAVGLLAGGLAHDFNNLLTAILGFVSLAKMQLPDDHPVASLVDRIESACGRAGGMTRQLLAFSKHNFVEIESLDANAIVRELSRILGRVVNEDIQLTVDCSPEQLVVRADRTQLDQVIINLCTNACHAMPDGGQLRLVTERVAVNEASVRHPDAPPGPYLRLSVADSGIGIEPAHLERIWEPFFTTKEEGTGLGLATVYAVVRRLNGFINVESERGRGTRFEVYLPLAATGVQPTAPEPIAALGGGETILLVDDEPMLRELVGDGLSLYGYRVLCAASGEEAIELFRQRGDEIALAVVDVVMPQMSGPTLSRRLLQEWPGTPILLMSGHAPEKLVEDARTLPTIAKPFKVPALAQRIRALLGPPQASRLEAAR